MEPCDSSYESDSSIETLWDEDHYHQLLTNLKSNQCLEEIQPLCNAFNQIKHYKELVLLMINLDPKHRLSVIFKECLKCFHFKLLPHQEEILKQKLSKFKNTFESKWKKNRRIFSRFEKNETGWLNSFITVPETWFSFEEQRKIPKKKRKTTSSSTAEPDKIPGDNKKFTELNKRDQQKAVQKVTQRFSALPTTVILKSTQQVLSKRGRKSESLLIKGMQENYNSTPQKLSTTKTEIKTPTQYSADEALALILEMSLSKSSYQLLRRNGIEHNAKIYPSWNDVVAAKKLCYPKEIEVKENFAKVSLQNLLDHTTHRLFQLQFNVMSCYFENKKDQLTCTLFATYGFDGSSGHSRYNQTFVDEPSSKSDETLFATTVIPMRIVASNGDILWHNPVPQSTRFCRPLKLEFIKETTKTILDEKNSIQKEIQSLMPTKVKVGSSEISVNFDLSLTSIDGKCLMAITGVTKSSQSCPICGATPKTFNDSKNLENSKFKPKKEALLHGISPLHCWIRLMEFCLKLAYRKPGGAYPVTRSEHKKLYAETKIKIQQKLRDLLGILVDVVKQGSGTTNNGNMARKAFQNFEEFARILDIDSTFVWNLYIILVTMSSQLPIDSQKFKHFCLETYNRYISLYKWHPLSVTLHKILIHGSEIIEVSKLPLGLMSEEAAESRNKIYRQDREHHARKMSRVLNVTDFFNRGQESSDVIISSIFLSSRNPNRHRFQLPKEVLNLLAEPEIPKESLHAVSQAWQVPLASSGNDPDFFSVLDDLQLEEDSEEDDEC